MASIKCGNCTQTHDSVSAVRACYNGPTAQRVAVVVTAAAARSTFPAPAPAADPATVKQVSFIASLAAERGVIVAPPTSKKAASAEIERLLAMPKVAPVAAAKGVAAAARTEPEDGIYIVKGDDPVAYSYVDRQDLVPFREDAIYKVYKMVHGSGRQGVKRLRTEGKSGSFEYLGLASRCLPTNARRMTLEEAKKFGALYGFCVKCGRTLTDENSIAAGIGPVCAGKGW